MLRRLSILTGLTAIVGFAVYWWLTIPVTIAASALPAYTPDLANGKTTFNAGGCSSCHGVPKQEDRTRLGVVLDWRRHSEHSMCRISLPIL